MNKYMKTANELAKENITSNNGGPFGAVVVKNGEIVGKGNNNVLANNDPTAHAEIMAIRDACKTLNTFDLSECEIYTSCYPCPMCLSAIIWANIKTAYYGNTKEDAENIGFRDNHIYKYIGELNKKLGTELKHQIYKAIFNNEIDNKLNNKDNELNSKSENKLNNIKSSEPILDILKLIPMDREETLKVFTEYSQKENKTIY